MLSRIDLRASDQMAESLPSRPKVSDSISLDTVREVIAEVRSRGDQALYELTERFDGVRLNSLVVPSEEAVRALTALDLDLRHALEKTEAAVRHHYTSRLSAARTVSDRGLRIRTVVQPVARAGCYVPGGQAAYPSTVLMTAVIARVAGVETVVVCVPPGTNGEVAQPTLAAAVIAGVDTVHPVGGAQAIAAMAYGTESIRPVDVIVGPGNEYVALAKREVAGIVGVPSAFAGPSEVVVVADGMVPVDFVAVDLCAQAEHGPDGMAWLITWDEKVADGVDEALSRMIDRVPRSDAIASTLSTGGHCVIVEDREKALDVINAIAPEHLQLMVADSETMAERVRNAGAVFCGPWSPASLGDYVVGPSHVLPTAGTARFSSALTVEDFTKDMHIVTADRDALRRLGPQVEVIAVAEGLDVHAESIRVRAQHG